MDQSTPLQFSLQPFGLYSNWTLKRETTNEIKRELEQTAAADLLPIESHAIANVSLLACLQKLSTAALL